MLEQAKTHHCNTGMGLCDELSYTFMSSLTTFLLVPERDIAKAIAISINLLRVRKP